MFELSPFSRHESFLVQRFERKLDTVKFQELLHTSFVQGGVGLWKKKAERVSAYIETLVEKQKDLSATIDLINKNPELPVSEEVRQLRGWILGEYVGEITPYKAEILDELINH